MDQETEKVVKEILHMLDLQQKAIVKLTRIVDRHNYIIEGYERRQDALRRD